MSICKECLDKIDWDFKGAYWFKCSNCEGYYIVTSNIQPLICEVCADELQQCEICEKDLPNKIR
jgi:hypothetical protein